MKSDFYLRLDDKGNISIAFRQLPDDNSVEQKLLERFIVKAIIKGIELKKVGSFISETGKVNWNNYEIKIKQ